MINKILHEHPHAQVYFIKGFGVHSVSGEEDDKSLSFEEVNKNITSIEIEDIVDLSITLIAGDNSPSTFTLIIDNKNDQYFVPDNPEEAIKVLVDDVERQRDYLQNTGFLNDGEDPGHYYAYKDATDWLHAVEAVLIDGDDRFLLYREEKQFYYYDRSGNRHVTSIDNKDGYETIHIKDGMTLGEISRDSFGDPSLWSLIQNFAGNSERLKNYTSNRITSETVLNTEDIETVPPVLAGNLALPLLTRNIDGRDVTIVVFPHSHLFYRYGGDLSKGRSVFSPMDRVVIFLSSWLEDSKNRDVRVFTGFVDTVDDSYGENNQQINITGTDITKWLMMHQVNVNPALLQIDDFLKVNTIKQTTNIFAGLTGPKIIKRVVLGDENAISATTEGMGLFELSMVNGEVETAPAQRYKYQTINRRLNGSLPPDILSTLQVHQLRIQDPFDQKYGTNEEILKSKTLAPFRRFWNNSWQLWQSEYQDKRTICYEVAQKTNFLFYADGNGDLNYHQPRYDISHILTHSTPELLIFEDVYIRSWSLSESDQNIVTRQYVTGELDFIQGVEPEVLGLYAWYQDERLAQKFGQRIDIISEPMIGANVHREGGFLSDANLDYFFFAKSLVQRKAAERNSGTVTLSGRAELIPGYPCYIPSRNLVYHISQVSHSFSWGSSFETTATLDFGRKPWEPLDEMLTYTPGSILSGDERATIIAGRQDAIYYQPSPIVFDGGRIKGKAYDGHKVDLENLLLQLQALLRGFQDSSFTHNNNTTARGVPSKARLGSVEIDMLNPGIVLHSMQNYIGPIFPGTPWAFHTTVGFAELIAIEPSRTHSGGRAYDIELGLGTTDRAVEIPNTGRAFPKGSKIVMKYTGVSSGDLIYELGMKQLIAPTDENIGTAILDTRLTKTTEPGDDGETIEHWWTHPMKRDTSGSMQYTPTKLIHNPLHNLSIGLQIIVNDQALEPIKFQWFIPPDVDALGRTQIRTRTGVPLSQSRLRVSGL